MHILLREAQCAAEHTEKYIPRELGPPRALWGTAIILPLGHGLMAEPWVRLGLGTTE
jgi:hypothetical protein